MTETVLQLNTRAHLDAVDITDLVTEALAGSGNGVALIDTPHTTVGLVLGPGDRRDASRLHSTRQKVAVQDTVPSSISMRTIPILKRTSSSSFAGTSVLVHHSEDGPSLGKYQRVIFLEFDGPRTRRVVVRRLGGDQ